MASFDLLDKRELQIVGVELRNADLNRLAEVVAAVLAFDRREVLVTDYLNNVLTFDIMRPTVYPHSLLDKSAPLLDAIASVEGVVLSPDASVEARGMLGWIAADREDLGPALEAASASASSLLAMLSKRVLILSTGAEVVDGSIVDTNSATITERLEPLGYRCERGEALHDDVDLIAGRIRMGIAKGFGLVITTGGVGAESKDCTVEAVCKVDRQASTPYLAHFSPNGGRHVKDGVRIAVGRYEGARIVSLPGPNDEVSAALDALVAGFAAELDDAALAERIAVTLRGTLRQKMAGFAHLHDQTPPRRITKELLDAAPGLRRGTVLAAEDGVVAGIGLLDASAAPDPAGTWAPLRKDGERVRAGEAIVAVTGSAWELAVAEDHVLGILGFSGGLARRALAIRDAAPQGLRIVCGGWKKLPASLKPAVRAALDVAGIGHRLLDGEFVYVDKNVVTQLGGVDAAVRAARNLGHGAVAVQVTDAAGALEAVNAACGVVMVDTGDLSSLHAVVDAVRGAGSSVPIAFAGGVGIDDLQAAFAFGASIVDVGRAVFDAPLWDLRFVAEPLSAG